MRFDTMGVCTIPGLFCTTCGSGSFVQATVQMTGLALARRGRGPNQFQPRSVNYASNILYVLAFMACGDGGTEAQKVLGFLGMPNYASMGKNTFHKIEK